MRPHRFRICIRPPPEPQASATRRRIVAVRPHRLRSMVDEAAWVSALDLGGVMRRSAIATARSDVRRSRFRPTRDGGIHVKHPPRAGRGVTGIPARALGECTRPDRPPTAAPVTAHGGGPDSVVGPRGRHNCPRDPPSSPASGSLAFCTSTSMFHVNPIHTSPRPPGEHISVDAGAAPERGRAPSAPHPSVGGTAGGRPCSAAAFSPRPQRCATTPDPTRLGSPLAIGRIPGRIPKHRNGADEDSLKGPDPA